jgi:hypothetical protein
LILLDPALIYCNILKYNRQFIVSLVVGGLAAKPTAIPADFIWKPKTKGHFDVGWAKGR